MATQITAARLFSEEESFFGRLAVLREYIFRKMLETINAAPSGHLGACCSSLDLMTVLYFGDILRYDSADSKHPLRDYVLNRGHLGPLKYNIFGLIGWLEEKEMEQYRRFGSRLAGHEDMNLTPGVDISPCGSLGMTLSYAVGAIIGFRDLGMPNRVFCFLGDGEEQEGNISEAARYAGHLKLKNLICVIDKNGGQLSGRLSDTDGAVDLHALWKSYGWQVINVADGHDHKSIYDAYCHATKRAARGPVCIIAKTIKGYGIPGCEEDHCGYHVVHRHEGNDIGRWVDLERVGDQSDGKLDVAALVPKRGLGQYSPPKHEPPPGPIEIEPLSGKFLCYQVLREFVRKLEGVVGDRLYVLTSDYPPRDMVYEKGKFFLERCRYHNVGIREQHMTAMAHGIAQVRKDAEIVILCGDPFIYRHLDQINILAQAKTKIMFFAVQGGLSGAENGTTHQSSGQPGALLTMPGVVCEEPYSADELIGAGNGALARQGPTYIRLHKLPIPWSMGGRYENGCEIVRLEEGVDAVIITSGMMAGEAVEACKRLESEGIRCNLVNVVRISSCENVAKCVVPHKPLFILYNGNPRILSSVVCEDICRNPLHVPSTIVTRGFEFGKTGSVKDLMRHFGLDAESVAELVRQYI